MIKYLNLQGYINLGEFGMFSHIYRFVKQENAKNLFILVNGYKTNNNLWIGYIFDNKVYENIKLSNTEEKFIIENIAEYVGSITRINDLTEFSKGTILQDEINKYKRSEKNDK
ncbi:MAG: hypothetical protein ACFFC1_18555 [Promethearchaeota archaeon]